MTLLPEGAPILTADAMRAAEDAAFATGMSQDVLMECAGRAVAQAARRLAAGRPIVVAAGPGNNGGDAYVAARLLRDWGHDVVLGTFGGPKGGAASRMAARWSGEAPSLEQMVVDGAYLLVDGLFGTGLTRPLALADGARAIFVKAQTRVAIDLPSGIATDTGAPLGQPAPAEATIALGALKPAHLLASDACGHVLLDDLGLTLDGRWRTAKRPTGLAPAADAHKYRRKVMILSGVMPGAARLAARGAVGAGAGYVVLLGVGQTPLDSIVHQSADTFDGLLAEDKGVMVIGPGLGRDAAAQRLIDAAIASSTELLLDGDALSLLGSDAVKRLAGRPRTTLTPHEGEFARMFGSGAGGKIARTLAAAQASGATIVHKGAVTVIASPDGTVRVSTAGARWLATAGTGDVLAGAIAAQGPEAGVWLHARASHHAGAAFSADRLADMLPQAIAECR